MVTRREFLVCAALMAASPRVDAWRSDPPGRLRARVKALSKTVGPGQRRLFLGDERDGVFYMPAGGRRPVPLLVMLHGAGGRGAISETLQGLADRFGVAVLAPDSRGATWDIVLGSAGADVDFIDEALAQTFGRCAVDAGRLAIGGFSDGASYALWLGVNNGDLFTHIIAFSPGFVAPSRPQGSPRVFISHGTHDPILPIERASRAIVPELEKRGYRVTYREFDGKHAVSPELAAEAFEWFVGK